MCNDFRQHFDQHDFALASTDTVTAVPHLAARYVVLIGVLSAVLCQNRGFQDGSELGELSNSGSEEEDQVRQTQKHTQPFLTIVCRCPGGAMPPHMRHLRVARLSRADFSRLISFHFLLLLSSLFFPSAAGVPEEEGPGQEEGHPAREARNQEALPERDRAGGVGRSDNHPGVRDGRQDPKLPRSQEPVDVL